MFSFDGPSRRITISGITTVNALDLYKSARAWESLPENMHYVSPLSVRGYADIGNGVFTDAIFTLNYGWKIRAAGYGADTQIYVVGTLITDDGSRATVPALIGSPVSWFQQVGTSATVFTSSGGSGGSSRPKKGVELTVPFSLRSTTGTLVSGAHPTSRISGDTSQLTNTTNPVADLGSGEYAIALTAIEMYADSVYVEIKGLGCLPLTFTILTQS